MKNYTGASPPVCFDTKVTSPALERHLDCSRPTTRVEVGNVDEPARARLTPHVSMGAGSMPYVLRQLASQRG